MQSDNADSSEVNPCSSSFPPTAKRPRTQECLANLDDGLDEAPSILAPPTITENTRPRWNSRLRCISDSDSVTEMAAEGTFPSEEKLLSVGFMIATQGDKAKRIKDRQIWFIDEEQDKLLAIRKGNLPSEVKCTILEQEIDVLWRKVRAYEAYGDFERSLRIHAVEALGILENRSD